MCVCECVLFLERRGCDKSHILSVIYRIRAAQGSGVPCVLGDRRVGADAMREFLDTDKAGGKE